MQRPSPQRDSHHAIIKKLQETTTNYVNFGLKNGLTPEEVGGLRDQQILSLVRAKKHPGNLLTANLLRAWKSAIFTQTHADVLQYLLEVRYANQQDKEAKALAELDGLSEFEASEIKQNELRRHEVEGLNGIQILCVKEFKVHGLEPADLRQWQRSSPRMMFELGHRDALDQLIVKQGILPKIAIEMISGRNAKDVRYIACEHTSRPVQQARLACP